MTGLATLFCGWGPWVPFNGMVVFHVAFIPLIMTLHAGFGAYIYSFSFGSLRGGNKYSSKNDYREDEKLLHH
jgi:hypothetical protein